MHGFLYESQIINRYKLVKCEKYISEYDVHLT